MSEAMAEQLVLGGVVQMQQCGLYISHHVPVIEHHHVCPESWWVKAGKDPDQSPRATLCPNCHMNTHAAIDAHIEGHDASLLPPRTRKLAAQAFTIAADNGLTPALTL
jgi:hypothetical protein